MLDAVNWAAAWVVSWLYMRKDKQEDDEQVSGDVVCALSSREQNEVKQNLRGLAGMKVAIATITTTNKCELSASVLKLKKTQTKLTRPMGHSSGILVAIRKKNATKQANNVSC
jgi:hypothetical protein